MNRTTLITLLGIAVMAGCTPSVYRHTALPDVKGARGFSMNAMYGAGKGDIVRAREVMGESATTLCGGAYTVVSEQNRPDISPIGDAELLWVIRCDTPPK